MKISDRTKNFIYRGWEGFKVASIVGIFALFTIAAIAQFHAQYFLTILEMTELHMSAGAILGMGWFTYLLLSKTQSRGVWAREQNRIMEQNLAEKDLELGQVKAELGELHSAKIRLEEVQNSLAKSEDELTRNKELLETSQKRQEEITQRHATDIADLQSKYDRLNNELIALKAAQQSAGSRARAPTSLDSTTSSSAPPRRSCRSC